MTLTTTRQLFYRTFKLCRASRFYSSSTPLDVVESDIVIVGGGPVGLALASALSCSPSLQKRMSVTLVEGGDLEKLKTWSPPSDKFSNRVVSLTNTTKSFLENIGVWKYLNRGRTCQLQSMQVWDGLSDSRIEFSAEDLLSNRGADGMATLTENFNLQRALLCHLSDIPAVRILQRTKVTSIQSDGEQRGSWPLVHLDNQQVLRARLLVGADGFNSPVRSFAQISSYGWSYDAQAIVATLVHPPRSTFEGPNHTAYQRFLPTGPIAFLPLTPTVSSLVWSTKSALASSLLACDPAVLAIMINAAFRLPYLSVKYLHDVILEKQGEGIPLSADMLKNEIQWRETSHGIHEHSAYSSLRKLGDQGIPPADSEAVPPVVTDLQVGTVASFPLRYSHAESYIGEGSGARTVLVGDAAHTLHPLAGQGLNLGLGDVECLARCIKEALATGGDIGSHTVLLPFTQERYLANHILMSSIDKLHKIYGTDNEAVVRARSVGVEALNELDSIKAAMMMFVGADGSKQSSVGSMGWNLAGNAVETLATVVKTMKGAVQSVASRP